MGGSREASAGQSVSHNDDETDNDDMISIRSSLSRKSQLPPELSEPLTSGDGNGSNNNNDDDPFYVFRSDLYRKLDSVDESLAEFLRVVHQTVSTAAASATHFACSRRQRTQYRLTPLITIGISIFQFYIT